MTRSGSRVPGSLPPHKRLAGSRRIPRKSPTRTTDSGAAGRFDGTGWIAWTVTLAPAAVALIRIAAAGRLDPDLTTVIVQTINIPAISIQSLFYLLPYAAALVLPLLLVGAYTLASVRRMRKENKFKTTKERRTSLLASALGSVVYCSLIFEEYFYQFIFVGFGLAGIAASFAAAKPEWRKSIQVATVILLGVVVAAPIVKSPMWIPMEAIKIQGQPASIQYVLYDGDNTATLLNAQRDKAVIVKQEDISSRVLCRAENDTFDNFPGKRAKDRGNISFGPMPYCSTALRAMTATNGGAK